jgi:plastocyanin
MSTRTLLWLAGILLAGVVIVSGAGMALAWGHYGGMPWNAGPNSMMGGQSGHNSMMGPNGSGSMMGPGGHGSMMGGQPSATPQTTPAIGVTQVKIVNFAFAPASMQVPAGTQVTWTNLDTAPHTVTFTESKSGSSTLQQGQTFSYTFKTPGTYAYYCAVHPYMTATVIVSP